MNRSRSQADDPRACRYRFVLRVFPGVGVAGVAVATVTSLPLDEIARAIDERMQRVRAAQLRIDAARKEFGVKPGESLWLAMFGEPFPLAVEEQDA